jgi:hypothetical protein
MFGFTEQLCCDGDQNTIAVEVITVALAPMRERSQAQRLTAHEHSTATSANGPKLTCRIVKRMSDVEGRADIKSWSRHFR